MIFIFTLLPKNKPKIEAQKQICRHQKTSIGHKTGKAGKVLGMTSHSSSASGHGANN
jgi:hypothetical protein